MLGWWDPPPSHPRQALVSSAASFIHHGYITEVGSMRLENINLSEVARASSLAHVNGTNYVTSNIDKESPILSKIKCGQLQLSKMRFSTADTAALVQGMRHSVARLVLGVDGPVELDWDTLLTYDGGGHCGGWAVIT